MYRTNREGIIYCEKQVCHIKFSVQNPYYEWTTSEGAQMVNSRTEEPWPTGGRPIQFKSI